jgi:hypothetical protein
MLVALALSACGGGGGDGSSSSTASTPSSTAAEQPAALEQLKRQAAQIRRERQRQSRKEEQERVDEDPAPPAHAGQPAQAEVQEHDDSGGGAAQFRHQGGDNSIQDFGEEADASEREEAAAALHGYLDARARERWSDTCSYLSADVIASLEQFAISYGHHRQEGCPEILAGLSSGSGKGALELAAEVDVGSLRRQGNRGFLLYHGADAIDYAIPVVKEAGEWKIAAPGGTPIS